mgnify:CR=1 FL=1
MSIFSAPAPSFYGAADKAIYDQGFSFIPQEMYRGDFVAPVFPTAPTKTTGGITTVPRTTALDIGGNRDDNNPFNPNMDQIRTDFRPDFEFRRGTEAPLGVIPGDTSMFDIRSLGLGLRTETERNKFMDMYPEFFDRDTGVPRTGIAGFFDKAINFIPGAGMLSRIAPAIQNILPVNQRAILENQARGQGIFTDDIGRIVGDPNTVGGVMAGYNLDKMTKGTFDKRLGTIGDTLKDKYGIDVTAEGFDISDIDEDDPAFGLASKYDRIGKAKLGFIDSKRRAKIIEDQRIAEQKEKERLAKIEKARQDKIRLDKLRLKRKAEQAAAARAKAYNERVAREARTAARARARNRAVYERADRQGFTNRDGGFSTSRADRAGTSEGSGQFSSRSGRGRQGYMIGGLTDLVDIYD